MRRCSTGPLREKPDGCTPIDRVPAEYKIPRGDWFEMVTSAHYWVRRTRVLLVGTASPTMPRYRAGESRRLTHISPRLSCSAGRDRPVCWNMLIHPGHVSQGPHSARLPPFTPNVDSTAFGVTRRTRDTSRTLCRYSFFGQSSVIWGCLRENLTGGICVSLVHSTQRHGPS